MPTLTFFSCCEGFLSAKRIEALWKEAREGCQVALEAVGVDFSDPPSNWFYHQRWTGDGICPRDGLPIQTATIGSRTTPWRRRRQR